MKERGKSIIVMVAWLLMSAGVFAGDQSAGGAGGVEQANVAAAPAPPTITWPTPGMVLGSNQPDIIFSGGGYDSFEVHICGTHDPGAPSGWDSVKVWSTANSVMTGSLSPQTTYFAFVGLYNAGVWSGWSAFAHHFYVAGEFMNAPTWLYGSGQAWNQDIAYNPERNEYLLAFFEMQSDSSRRISYFRLDGNGNPIGGRTTVTDDNYGTHMPAVTYNSVNDEYLIAYTAYRNGWGGDLIYVQRVNANTGAKIGSAYCIHNCSQSSAGIDRHPSVAHSPTSNTYLVAWGNEGNWKVYGVLLAGADGHVITGDILITPNNLGDDPSVCWNSAADEFYVAYQAENGAYGTGWDIAGQRVGASDGTVLGGHLLMANSTGWEWKPGVEYDSVNNRYLVAYGGAGYVGVWGQFVTPANNLDGPRFSLLAPPLMGGGSTSVSYQPGPKEFLVTWMDQDSAGQYGRRLSGAGTPIGEPFRINGSIGGVTGNFDPVNAANTTSGEYLICFSNAYTALYTRRYKPYPLPPPDTQPPDPVANLVVSRAADSMHLSWTNPTTWDFCGTLIRVKVGSPPAGPEDGTLVVDKPNALGTLDTYEDTAPRPRGVLLYYRAFAHDLAPNHAEPATDHGTLVAGDFNADEDVDQEDFGRLQVCLGDDGIRFPAGCEAADFDLDADVDAADLASFAACVAGPDRPPACGP